MIIRLSSSMTSLLEEIAKKCSIDTKGLLQDDRTWRLAPEDRETLVEAISLEFAATGLQSDSEPNTRGFKLEELLDKINKWD